MNEWFIFFVANFILKIRWTYIIFRFWHCLSNNENTFLLFDYSNKYSFYHLFIFSRCSRYHQIRLSEKWPSPERRSPREKLAGPNCRRNMYAYSILLNMIKYYFMYYINITNKTQSFLWWFKRLWRCEHLKEKRHWVSGLQVFPFSSAMIATFRTTKDSIWLFTISLVLHLLCLSNYSKY